MTTIIPFLDHKSIEQGLEVLGTGDVIAFPTDTVYGIAVSAFDAAGIEKLFQIKGRLFTKAIAVLIGSHSQLYEVAEKMPEFAEKLANRFWPGALTLILPKKTGVPENLSPFPTIGVRMPDHDLLRELIGRSGPLATTSANLSGEKNSDSAQEVMRQLGGKIAAVLDGGETAGEVASTVVDCSGEKARILRPGVIQQDALFQVLGSDIQID